MTPENLLGEGIGKLSLSRQAYYLLVRAGVWKISQLMELKDADLLMLSGHSPTLATEIRSKLQAFLESAGNPPFLPGSRKAKDETGFTAFDISPALYQISIDELNLSTRVYNALQRQGLTTLEHVALILETYQSSGDIPVRNMGEKGVTELGQQFTKFLSSHKPGQQAPDSASTESKLSSSPIQSIDTSRSVEDLPILDLLAELGQRDRLVLEMRFGLKDGTERTLQEVAQTNVLTRERIRQIESRCIRQLKKNRGVSNWIKQLEFTLSKLGDLATDQEVEHHLQVVASAAGFNTLGLVRLLAAVSEPDILRLRLSDEKVWLLNHSSPEVFLHYLDYAARDELRSRGIALKKSELWASLKSRPDFPEKLSDTFFFAFLRVNPDFVFYEDDNIGLEKWSGKTVQACVIALRRIGHPAHFNEIAQVVKEIFGPETDIRAHPVHAALQRRPTLFARVGQGTYGLVEWGLEQVEFYPDIIERIFHKVGHPLSLQEIFTRVCEIRDSKESTVMMLLTLNDRFRAFPGEVYGLADWREEDFSDLSYREKRLLEVVVEEDPQKKRRPKPQVIQALSDIDELISHARSSEKSAGQSG